jgi:hypothetical protein
MRFLTTITFAAAFALVTSSCKNDKSADSPVKTETPPPAPAEKAPPATAAESAPATPADGAKTAIDHTGHRHEPTDPYYCPMDTEETSDKPGTKCPVCQMEMVVRKK